MAAHESLDWREQGPFVKRGQGLTDNMSATVGDGSLIGFSWFMA